MARGRGAESSSFLRNARVRARVVHAGGYVARGDLMGRWQTPHSIFIGGLLRTMRWGVGKLADAHL